MSRVEERQRQSRQDLGWRVVLQAHEPGDTGFGIGLCIERLETRQILLPPFPVFPLDFFLVQVAGVRQHDRAECPAGLVGIDRSLEAFPDKARYAPGMVDMRMTEHDGVYPGNVDRECFAIAELVFTGALHQAAFEQ